MPLREALHQTEKLIDQALIETEGNILQAAKMLGIPRQTLQYKLSRQNRRIIGGVCTNKTFTYIKSNEYDVKY